MNAMKFCVLLLVGVILIAVVSLVFQEQKLVCHYNGEQTVHAIVKDYHSDGNAIKYVEILEDEKVRRVRHLLLGETCSLYK